MQAMALLMFLIIIFALLAGILPAASEWTANPELSAFYEDCIDQIIRRCEEEAVLVDSHSDFIRNYALKIAKKAAYCKHNRPALINEMLAKNIGRSSYKVGYFVNQKFLDVLRAENGVKSNSNSHL